MTYDLDQLDEMILRHKRGGPYYDSTDFILYVLMVLPALLADARLGQQVRQMRGDIRAQVPMRVDLPDDCVTDVCRRLLTAIDGQRESFKGLRLVIDDTVKPSVIQLRHTNGRVLYQIYTDTLAAIDQREGT